MTPLDGTSLVPVLRDPHAGVKEAAVSVTERLAPPLGHTIRAERWRYTLWPDGSQELYDHRHDPGESRNLATDPGLSARVGELRSQLLARLDASKELNAQVR